MIYDDYINCGNYHTLITVEGIVLDKMPTEFALQWAKLNSATLERTELIETDDGNAVYIKCSIPFKNIYQRDGVKTAVALYNQRIDEIDQPEARSHNIGAVYEETEDGKPLAVMICNLYERPANLVAELCDLKRELNLRVPEYTATYRINTDGRVSVTSVEGETIQLSKNDIDHLFKAYQREFVLKNLVEDKIEELTSNKQLPKAAADNTVYIKLLLDFAEHYVAENSIEAAVAKAFEEVQYQDFSNILKPVQEKYEPEL